MPNTILVGAQWGDEGKGKIIDYLTEDVDLVVRSQGGNNAGHTVIIGEAKYVLHLIPSGILRKDKTCVIGNGVVIDPVHLVGEIDGLRKQRIGVRGRLWISDCAHIVFPYHRSIDETREQAKGKGKIGTTKRGIGPCYGDKVERSGLRMGDLLNWDRFRSKLRRRLTEVNRTLKAAGAKPLSLKKIESDFEVAAKTLRPLITNTTMFLHKAMAEGRTMLFEGAQGTFLDLDHGTYPYVTSSNTTAGGACTGTGVPPQKIDEVLGVMKAYTTRVGEGPFPTEDPALSKRFHGMGREFGATTGRARRCGWLDMVSLRYATILNGIDQLAITNLDGLDGLEKIRICTAYKLGRKTLDVPPSDAADLAACQPVYTEVDGWRSDTSQATTWDELPTKAKQYLKKICSLTGTRLSMVSVGPGRDQTIRL